MEHRNVDKLDLAAAPGNGAKVGPRACRVYVSCPLTLFGTIRYERAQRLLRNRFKRAVFLLPDQLFKNREEWIAGWHLVSRDLTDLVILTDGAGYIGRGGFTEVRTALARGARVWFLSHDNQLVPFDRLTPSETNETDWCRYCRFTIRTEEETA